MVPSEAPRSDEATVKVSSQSEHICLPNLTSKVLKNPQFPAKSIAPAAVHRLETIDTLLESSTLGDLPVKISAESESVCCTKSTGEVPTLLFTESPSVHSSIPATSGNHFPIGASICNPHSKALPLVPLSSSETSPAAGNFRSTNVNTIPSPSPEFSFNSVAFAVHNFNSFGHNIPQTMGNRSMSSISGNASRIKNAQIGGFGPSSSPSLLIPGVISSGFQGELAGSGFPSSSPVDRCSPATVVRVDSAESPIPLKRVDSAVPILCTSAPVDSTVVSARYVPPTISFRDIVRRSSPASQTQSFADVHESMDEVPDPTDRDGIPGILFPDQVISSLSAPFKFALIGRISGNRGITPNKDILSALSCTGLLGSHTVRFLPRGYMVLTLSCEEDYLKFWERPEISIRTVVIRFSKWTPEFKYEVDSSIVPVWVRFPDLPLHLYDKKSLYPIAKILGNPVKVDEITADGSRGSFARVCVEIDVLKPRPGKIWVGWGDHSQIVEVIYETVPHFCTHCQMLGHSLDFCSRIGQSFRSRRRGPQRQAASAPPPSDQQNQGPRPHGKGIVSDSPIQAPSVPSQGVTSDQALSSDSDFLEQVVKRPRRRPVVRKDPNRPISEKNYYEVLQDLPTDSGHGESSGTVQPRTHRVKSLLNKLVVEGNIAAGHPFRPHSARSSSSQSTVTVDVVNSSVTAVPAPVDVPVQVVELVPAVQDIVVGTPVSSPLPSLMVFDSASVGSMTGVVTSSTTECLSLPLPGRTRSQQRRYYRNKALQSSLPYGRPPEPG